MVLSSPQTRELIERLDAATSEGGVEEVTAGVKEALSECVDAGLLQLGEAWTRPRADGYGRRLLHRSPDGRYTVIAMVWGSGQGTPIHDHDDMWCVECVYQGQILVTSYDVCPTANPDQVTFEFCDKVEASIGEAGALIPPHDYHVIENRGEVTAVTIHVYGGEMEACNIFEPVEGSSHLYERRRKPLSYDAPAT